MKLYAGVDGGQSSTVVALGDGEREIARAVGPPADLVGLARDADRQVDAVRATVLAALREGGLDPHTRVTALVAGISGFDRGESREPDFAAVAERAMTLHDAEIAHAGAFSGGAGIVVIAGTGSVALGRRERGDFVRAGGWGYFFGDEGSATWIARTALRRAMASADRGESGSLEAAARAFFGATTLRAIQHAFAHGELERPTLAAFAGDVLDLARDGDGDAVAVRDAACDALAELVAIVAGRLGPLPVSYTGGLFASPDFVGGFRAAVARVAAARVEAPASDPAGGALVLARRLA